jgi:hypothetical protein
MARSTRAFTDPSTRCWPSSSSFEVWVSKSSSRKTSTSYEGSREASHPGSGGWPPRKRPYEDPSEASHGGPGDWAPKKRVVSSVTKGRARQARGKGGKRGGSSPRGLGEGPLRRRQTKLSTIASRPWWSRNVKTMAIIL